MKCALCEKEISGYNEKLNHLKIDETREVDVCTECVDKFLKWQQGVYADLFPTKAAKKRCGKSKND